ncbi:MAG: UbiD family decarboxylase [Chloroflexota bacterium]
MDDLRTFIEKARQHDEVQVVEGAHWDMEMGQIGEIQESIPTRPLLLFDKVPGYPPGFRVALNVFASPYRTAIALGLPPDLRGVELVKAFKNRIAEGIKRVPPVWVETGPVKENVLKDRDVDLLKFPVPKWHALDGGRYIGTGAVCIMRDPEEDWVNVSVYRVQAHSKDNATIMIMPGHHGRDIQKKYWSKGKPCPAAVAIGPEPIVWAAAAWEGKQWGISEYDMAGGLAGEAVKVTKSIYTDLPVPASAEIVLDGEILPPRIETANEGPFGEWAGYYAGGITPIPVFKVKTVMHRSSPIIQGNPPSILPSVWTLGRHLQKAASLWDELERQVGSIAGVWVVEEASIHGMVVIAVKQSYSGHAKHAGLIAAGSSATRIGCRYIILVDDDIDPANIPDVLWAISTRTDPATSIDIVRGCYGSAANPAVPMHYKEIGQFEESRAIINACRPYHLIKKYPSSIKSDAAVLKKVRDKWAHLFR